MINQIYEAYLQVVTEAVGAPKFKVGDSVGVGTSGSHGQYDYMPWHGLESSELGKVVKVHKNGDHTVELKTTSTRHSFPMSVTREFDHTGRSKDKFDDHQLHTPEDHHKMIQAVIDKKERARDLGSIRAHLDAHHVGTPNTGSTTYTKLSKESAAHMKAMIDKHTAED